MDHTSLCSEETYYHLINHESKGMGIVSAHSLEASALLGAKLGYVEGELTSTLTREAVPETLRYGYFAGPGTRRVYGVRPQCGD